jgi:hypothetical protein
VDGSHVVEAWDEGPVLAEHGAAVGIGFALPGDAHSGSFEAEVDAADA